MKLSHDELNEARIFVGGIAASMKGAPSPYPPDQVARMNRLLEGVVACCEEVQHLRYRIQICEAVNLGLHQVINGLGYQVQMEEIVPGIEPGEMVHLNVIPTSQPAPPPPGTGETGEGDAK